MALLVPCEQLVPVSEARFRYAIQLHHLGIVGNCSSATANSSSARPIVAFGPVDKRHRDVGLRQVRRKPQRRLRVLALKRRPFRRRVHRKPDLIAVRH